ncbi:hypothetical protein AAVH_24156 [Aphelenchoides avenae]|nr:hypothetical protein AAVH_24156 [Aphelenchus avenae]
MTCVISAKNDTMTSMTPRLEHVLVMGFMGPNGGVNISAKNEILDMMNAKYSEIRKGEDHYSPVWALDALSEMGFFVISSDVEGQTVYWTLVRQTDG